MRSYAIISQDSERKFGLRQNESLTELFKKRSQRDSVESFKKSQDIQVQSGVFELKKIQKSDWFCRQKSERFLRNNSS